MWTAEQVFACQLRSTRDLHDARGLQTATCPTPCRSHFHSSSCFFFPPLSHCCTLWTSHVHFRFAVCFAVSILEKTSNSSQIREIRQSNSIIQSTGREASLKMQIPVNVNVCWNSLSLIWLLKMVYSAILWLTRLTRCIILIQCIMKDRF